MNHSLLVQLKEIKKSLVSSNLSYSHTGICTKICGMDTTKEFLVLCRKWPNYSGVWSYPVPSTIKTLDAEGMYGRASHMWSYKYGNLRIELLNFVIDLLETRYAS